jgi:high affinity Mn2+ porin
MRHPRLIAVLISVLCALAVEGTAAEPLEGFRTSGAFTGILQGTIGNPKQFRGDRPQGTLSTDLFVETPVVSMPDSVSLFFLNVGVQKGKGLTPGNSLPTLFQSPNGQFTGPNNDVQNFREENAVNFKEARYEYHHFVGGIRRFRLVVGQLDLTKDFDTNQFANDQAFQFLAPIFNNSIAIDWGGQANFFGPGIVASYYPTPFVGFSAGYYQGEGIFEDLVNHPFMIVEGDVRVRPFGLLGNYRVYAWERDTLHPTQRDLTVFRSRNRGAGLSFDQKVSGSLGVWTRFGVQDARVSQFDKSASIGVEWVGPLESRLNDVWGSGYGVTVVSSQYRARTGFNEVEHYLETYYRIVTHKNFHVSPDLQYIINPGGNGAERSVFIYGVRLHVNF